jgi:hypothetical protein
MTTIIGINRVLLYFCLYVFALYSISQKNVDKYLLLLWYICSARLTCMINACIPTVVRARVGYLTLFGAPITAQMRTLSNL